MPEELFKNLCSLIKVSFISVQNNRLASIYSLETFDETGDIIYIDICSYYSHSDPKNSYVKYELYIDNELIADAIRPVFDKKSISAKQRTIANKLETLLSMCSMKIVDQERAGQSHHMLKTFINRQNINIH